MKTDHTLTAARLRELMRYEAETGTLHWRKLKPHMKSGPVGAPAGPGRRLQCWIDGRAQYVHRLVWLYHHDQLPVEQVDHIDGDKLNNRIENLRVLTNQENACNADRGGVSFEARKVRRPWRARITVNGRTISLGYWDTEAGARTEYLRAKLVYHPTFATGAGRAA